jgi:hypothetical protein
MESLKIIILHPSVHYLKRLLFRNGRKHMDR